jgi:hypothetical protein
MTLKSVLDDISREISIPDDVAGAALRLAARRRVRRRAMAPAGAIVAIALVVLAVLSVVEGGFGRVTPAAPPSGPGSVPSHVGAPQGAVRSVFDAPIWRASLLYFDRHDAAMLVSADGNEQRSLPVRPSGTYRAVTFALSPDGTKVAYGWVADDLTKVKKGDPRSELRIVTLATGRTLRLALPGDGFGDKVDHLTWSADGTRLLVQAVVIADVQPGGWGGALDTFVVDAATATRESSVSFHGQSLGGWSADGKRLLWIENDAVQITDLAGDSLRTLVLKALPGTGPYGDATSGDGAHWSPDENTVAITVGKALPGDPPDTVVGGVSRPFLLRALSLGPAGGGGDAAEIDVPLGSAQAASVIGWADDTHALVDRWLDGGAQRVESVDVRSGAAATVISVDPGTWQGISVAGDIVRAGGFR